jgi:hypothetical protein
MELCRGFPKTNHHLSKCPIERNCRFSSFRLYRSGSQLGKEGSCVVNIPSDWFGTRQHEPSSPPLERPAKKTRLSRTQKNHQKSHAFPEQCLDTGEA